MKVYCGVLDACDTTQRVSPDLTADSKPAVPLPGLETSPGRMMRAGKEQVRPACTVPLRRLQPVHDSGGFGMP